MDGTIATLAPGKAPAVVSGETNLMAGGSSKDNVFTSSGELFARIKHIIAPEEFPTT
jgi:hypothetical protein